MQNSLLMKVIVQKHITTGGDIERESLYVLRRTTNFPRAPLPSKEKKKEWPVSAISYNDPQTS